MSFRTARKARITILGIYVAILVNSPFYIYLERGNLELQAVENSRYMYM